ncbi:MAG: PEP/pyruvate-binding domain-containing protein, partial [Micropruina sp.]
NTPVREGIGAILAGLDGLSPAELDTAVARVQQAFLAAELPPGQLDALRHLLGTALPGVEKLKVRSSSNAEDIPNFDGAGLHDSFSASLDKKDDPTGGCKVVEEADGPETKRKVKPKSLGCAVRGVYASLWNRRAIAERRFARIDQSTIAMGLAIVGAYDNESEIVANAVLLTRVLNTDAVYGYSLSIQQGNNLVTNPDPGTHTEVTIAAFISDDEPISFTHARFAKPTREGPELTSPVLSRDQLVALVDLTRRVERAYCAAKPSYYPGPCAEVTFDNSKPRSLDLEVKVLADGRFVVKQVREFGGR